MIILFVSFCRSLIEAFERIASLLALRDDNGTVLLNVSGDTTAVIVERVLHR